MLISSIRYDVVRHRRRREHLMASLLSYHGLDGDIIDVNDDQGTLHVEWSREPCQFIMWLVEAIWNGAFFENEVIHYTPNSVINRSTQINRPWHAIWDHKTEDFGDGYGTVNGSGPRIFGWQFVMVTKVTCGFAVHIEYKILAGTGIDLFYSTHISKAKLNYIFCLARVNCADALLGCEFFVKIEPKGNSTSIVTDYLPYDRNYRE